MLGYFALSTPEREKNKRLRSNLSELYGWRKCDNMSLNLKKCKQLTFHRRLSLAMNYFLNCEKPILNCVLGCRSEPPLTNRKPCWNLLYVGRTNLMILVLVRADLLHLLGLWDGARQYHCLLMRVVLSLFTFLAWRVDAAGLGVPFIIKVLSGECNSLFTIEYHVLKIC